MLRRLAALLLLAVAPAFTPAGYACYLPLSRAVGVSSQLPAEEQPSQAPVEFRELTTAPIPESVPLLQLILGRPPSAEVRSELAGLYRAGGYYGAARFFENTGRMLEGERMLTDAIHSPVSWSANADVQSGRPRRVAEEVVRLVWTADYNAAIERAEMDIREHGPSLQVVVEWADAVLWNAIADRAAVRDEALESALRIVMTSIAEKVHRPHGFISRAGGYMRLSDVFLALGDDLSAITAAVLAVAVSRPGSLTTTIAASDAQQLCDRISQLRSRLRLAIDTSSLIACNE